MMAIQNSIQELTKGWKEMCRVNLFIPGERDSDKKLMRDLRRKVPEGSQLAYFLVGKDYEASTLDEWIAMIQVFQRACPAGAKGPDSAKVALDGVSDVRLAANAEEYIRAGKDVPMVDLTTGEDVRRQVDVENVLGEDGVPFGPWDAGFDRIVHTSECIYALSDAMNAAKRKTMPGRMSLRNTVGKDILDKYPRCKECGGRHSVSKCPNYLAGRDPTYKVQDCRAQQMYCMFSDSRAQGLVCGGMGHLAKHHNQAVAESAGGGGGRTQVRPQTGYQRPPQRTFFSPNTKGGKGKSGRFGGKGGGKSKGKGKGSSKGKGKGKRKGKSREGVRVSTEPTVGNNGETYDENGVETGRFLDDAMTMWIYVEDDWTAESCKAVSELNWMVYTTNEQVCFTNEGEQAMLDYVYTYEYADEETGDTVWTEPVAYSKDEEGEYDETDAGGSESVKTATEGQEGIRKVNEFRPIVFSGTLNDALSWKPASAEKVRVFRDVEVDEANTEVEEERALAGNERLPMRRLGYGWNCEVRVQIGGKVFTVLLDSGASRNIIQGKFRGTLQADPACTDCITGPYPGDRRISISGIHKDQPKRPENDISTLFKLVFSFDGEKYPLQGLFAPKSDMPQGYPVEVMFGEMESASDELLIGCPQLATWGYQVCRIGHVDKIPAVHLSLPNIWCKMVNAKENDELDDTVQITKSHKRNVSERATASSA